LPQPQRLRAGAGAEGTWDMVMEESEQDAAPHPAQAVSRGRLPPVSLLANPACPHGHSAVGRRMAKDARRLCWNRKNGKPSVFIRGIRGAHAERAGKTFVEWVSC